MACLLLPLLVPRPSGAAPDTRTLAVLIVSDGRTAAHLQKEEQIIQFIHDSLDEQGMPHSALPILTYHTNRPDERIYCEKRLGIRSRDLVFLGLAQHQNQVVKKVILREPNVRDPKQAVMALIARAVAVWKPTPSVSPPTPTPDVPVYTPPATRQTLPVVIGTLRTYFHRNVFSIKVPSGWNRKDNSHDREAILVWIDPTVNGFVLVDVFDSPQRLSTTDQIALLENFLRSTLGKFPEFTQEGRSYGEGALVTWSYMNDDPSVKIVGRSYMKQTRRRVSIVTYGIPEEQFSALEPSLQTIVRSLRVMSGSI